MTKDGVDGKAADEARAAAHNRPPGRLRIKLDDGRLAPRYIEPAYLHTPAGGSSPTVSGASGKWPLPCATRPIP